MSGVGALGIVGAGFMGTGIAESAAAAGKGVFLYEPAEAPLKRSKDSLRTSVEGKRSDEEASSLIDRITYTSHLEDLQAADAVIEAVSEDAAVKTQVFRMIDDALPGARFVASNTSSIPIAELGSHTTKPERVLGLHFFSPVPVMALVEVVVTLDTSEETVAVAEEFVGELGKRGFYDYSREGAAATAG